MDKTAYNTILSLCGYICKVMYNGIPCDGSLITHKTPTLQYTDKHFNFNFNIKIKMFELLKSNFNYSKVQF